MKTKLARLCVSILVRWTGASWYSQITVSDHTVKSLCSLTVELTQPEYVVLIHEVGIKQSVDSPGEQVLSCTAGCCSGRQCATELGTLRVQSLM